MNRRSTAIAALAVVAPLSIAIVGFVVLAVVGAAPWSALLAVVVALAAYFAFAYLRQRRMT